MAVNDIYYVDNTSSGAGTVNTLAAPGSNYDVQTALDAVNDGEIVAFVAGTYNAPAGGYVFDLNAGVNSAGTWENGGITFKAVNSSGVEDGSVAIFDGASVTSTNHLFWDGGTSTATGEVFMRNLTFQNTANSGAGIYFTTGSTVGGWHFYNCQFLSNTGEGLLLRLNQHPGRMINCVVDNNGASSGASNTNCWNGSFIYNCTFSNNTGDGLVLSSNDSTIMNCIFRNNSGDGLYVWGDVFEMLITDCIFHDNGAHGLSVNDNTSVARVLSTGKIINSVFTENANYGIGATTSSTSTDYLEYVVYNCLFNNNTSGHVVSGEITLDNTNIVDVDPGFVRTTGVPNFTPLPGSPLLNAGFPKRTH